MIDVVMIWVDGNDPDWINDFNKYRSNNAGDKRANRFRDWDNLKYWFRGIDKFMPWVRKVHFVTCGHYPNWLNLNSPKLHFVKHSDYIPCEYLPTFNANTIELNLHRIEGLSEKFIYFNDDMFVIAPVDKERFFKNDLPCDMGVHTALICNGIGHIVYNDIEIINRHFNKKDVIKKDFFKYFNLRYGKELLKNICIAPWPQITGFVNPHTAAPFLKSTFVNVWRKEESVLHRTCQHKFRTNEDVNQYLFRFWQICSGHFYPINVRKNTAQIAILKNNLNEIKQYITTQSKNIICLHDEVNSDFEYCKNKIIDYFEAILPEKSSFEI